MTKLGSNRWRLDAWGPPCKLDTVAVPIYAGGPRVQVRRELRESTTLLGAVFLRWGYVVRRIGGYNCRQITGGTSYSSHAWGLSIDVNDDTNPYRLDRLVTDMPYGMVQDVYAIRTIDGVQVWRWGGDWDGRPETRNSNYDAMHWECIASPDELARGFLRLMPASYTPLAFPVIRRGARGPIVLELQRLLSLDSGGVDTFGPRTEEAVRRYQRARGLVADGIVGAGTWTALLTNQPPLVAGGIPPIKSAAA